jgi:hypothetical protein
MLRGSCCRFRYALFIGGVLAEKQWNENIEPVPCHSHSGITVDSFSTVSRQFRRFSTSARQSLEPDLCISKELEAPTCFCFLACQLPLSKV